MIKNQKREIFERNYKKSNDREAVAFEELLSEVLAKEDAGAAIAALPLFHFRLWVAPKEE